MAKSGSAAHSFHDLKKQKIPGERFIPSYVVILPFVVCRTKHSNGKLKGISSYLPEERSCTDSVSAHNQSYEDDS